MERNPVYTAEAEKKHRISEALRYGYHDGTFGADVRALAEMNYTYVRNGKNASWFMFIVDTDIDTGYRRTRPADDPESRKDCFHAFTSMNTFSKPKQGAKGKSLKIDLDTPGLNAYILPQKMKRQFVTNETYFTMPAAERYKYSTSKTRWQNGWMRSKIYGMKMKAKYRHEKYGEPYDAGYFDRLIEKTRENDVKNPYTGRIYFAEADILAYQTIVIDIDNHTLPAEWVQVLCDKYAALLICGCDDNGEALSAVLPNYIVKTGRGLQLWFLIDPVYFPAVSMVKQTAAALCDEYQKITDRYCPDLEVDREASLNISGFKRLPGSYNFSAPSQDPDRFGQWGYKVTKHVSKIMGEKASDIGDMMRSLGLKVYTEEEKKAYREAVKQLFLSSDNREMRRHTRTDSPALKRRSMKMLPLFRDRARGMKNGDGRNDLLIRAGAVAKEAGEDVLSFLCGLADLFADKMNRREIEKTADSAIRHDYHYATATLADFLGADDAELMSYGLTRYGAFISNEERAKKRRAKRDSRDLRIKELLEKGISIAETSRIAGVCRATVRKVKRYLTEMAEAARQKKAEHIGKIKQRNNKCLNSFNQMLSVRQSDSYITDTDEMPYIISGDSTLMTLTS